SALEAPRQGVVIGLAPQAESVAASLRMTPARQRVIDFLGSAPTMALADLARESGVGAGVIKGMLAAGLLQAFDRPVPSRFTTPDPDAHGPALSPAQQSAAEHLASMVA